MGRITDQDHNVSQWLLADKNEINVMKLVVVGQIDKSSLYLVLANHESFTYLLF